MLLTQQDQVWFSLWGICLFLLQKALAFTIFNAGNKKRSIIGLANRVAIAGVYEMEDLLKANSRAVADFGRLSRRCLDRG
jgi:hypothetical protein